MIEEPQNNKGNPPEKQRDSKGRFLPGHNIGNRFEPGQSGNPNGRPRKDDCITSAVWDELEREPTLEADGLNGKGKTMSQIIARKAVRQAAAGDAKARDYVTDRTEGKVTDKHKMEGDIPVSIIFTEVGRRKDTDKDEKEE